LDSTGSRYDQVAEYSGYLKMNHSM